MQPSQSVAHRVVGLGHDGHTPSGQAFDEVHLPEWVPSVELLRKQPADEGLKLHLAARFRKCLVEQVAVEVEFAVVNPPSTGLEVLAKARHPIQARLEVSSQLPEGERPTRPRHRIEDGDAPHVHVHGRLLDQEERQVEGAQVVSH